MLFLIAHFAKESVLFDAHERSPLILAERRPEFADAMTVELVGILLPNIVLAAPLALLALGRLRLLLLRLRLLARRRTQRTR